MKIICFMAMIVALQIGASSSATIDRTRLNLLLNNADSRLNEVDITEDQKPVSMKESVGEQPSPALDISQQLRLIFASNKFEPPLDAISEHEATVAEVKEPAVQSNSPLFRHQLETPIKVQETDFIDSEPRSNVNQEQNDKKTLGDSSVFNLRHPANFFESALATLLKLSELSNKTEIATEQSTDATPTEATLPEPSAFQEEASEDGLPESSVFPEEDSLPQPSAFHLSSSGVSFREHQPAPREVLSPLAHILGSFAAESGPYRSFDNGFNRKYFI